MGGSPRSPNQRREAWREIDSTYVVATRDTIISPDLQREMAGRTQRSVEIDAGHLLPLSEPGALADEIARVAPG